MKKVALSLLAFALVGAMAFGQDAAPPVASISTEVNSGWVYSGNSSIGASKAYAIDYGAGGSYLGPVIGTTFALTGKNFGYSIEPIVKGATSGPGLNLFTLDHAWAYVSPFDGVSVYSGASGNNAPFGDLDDNGAGNYSTTSIGAFYSANGLSVGAQLQPSTGTANNAYWAGVGYASDGMFKVNAYGSNDGQGTLDQVHITAAFLAIPALTLNGGFNGAGMSNTSSASNFIDATGAYAVTDAFTAGLTLYADNLSGNTLSASNQAYYVFKPYVTYAVDPTVKVLAYYDGETNPSSTSGAAAADNQILAQLQWMPAAGVTIKFSGWYDTNVRTAGTLNSNYTGGAVTTGNSDTGLTSFAVDTKFVF